MSLRSAGGTRCAFLFQVFAFLLIAACSGGGGGGGGGSASARLLSIEFPDPQDVNTEPIEEPPRRAPLLQQIVLHFTAPPDASQVHSSSVQVRDSLGFPVAGELRVVDRSVVYTPRLPLRDADPESGDSGGTGFLPGSNYSLRVGPSTWSFVRDVAAELLERHSDPLDARGILVGFSTTSDPKLFFRGLAIRRPNVAGTDPEDASLGVSPHLYTDPDGIFSEPRPFFVTLDGPVHPSPLNVGRVALVDLDDRSGAHPAGLALGVHVRVAENRIDRSLLEIVPSGILPFGHMLAIELPSALRGVSAVNPDPGEGSSIAAVFTTENAPDGTIRDLLSEDFDGSARREQDSTLIAEGALPAEWNEKNSNVLLAGFGFEGAGELGRFSPPPPSDGDDGDADGGEHRIVFDTSRQQFPLLDGSTPDAPPGTEVAGGVFAFTDIDIPEGFIVEAQGPNPLVLTATGSVRIAGTIRLNGFNGNSEMFWDWAFSPNPGGPGGPGGGRGGEAHPRVFWPPGVPGLANLVSPIVSGRGWGPGNAEQIGGHGGQSGALDFPDVQGEYGTDMEVPHCQEIAVKHSNGFKAPGGGGGSMLFAGQTPPRKGKGNVLADGRGGYVYRREGIDPDWDKLETGEHGDPPFSNGNPEDDFIGFRGERKEVFAGQGGGGGGTALNGYYCGDWCLLDGDPRNDAVCAAEKGLPGSVVTSVLDARGGSAGGGGGAIAIHALGSIEILQGAVIECHGGSGRGGEFAGCSHWSGGGGGGSGGAILLQSAEQIRVADQVVLDVASGLGARVNRQVSPTSCNREADIPGAGGDGSIGIIQLRVPTGSTAEVHPGAQFTDGSWVDPSNERNPAEFSAISVAQSTWFDLGRVIARPPAHTNPLFRFQGVDPHTGLVRTDAEGYVLDPELADIRCDYLGRLDPLRPGEYEDGEEPRANFIPANATVKVEFQGADAIAEGSKEPDPASFTEWTSDAASLSSRQFLRFRITFDIAADQSPAVPTSRRPAVQWIRVGAEF